MKIAVLGAGIQGVCVALELAKRGYQVHLIDRNSAPVTKASLNNEGKLHLGFVYANESQFHTAPKMLQGSLQFIELMRTWCDLSDLDDYVSTPFYYGIHRRSMLSETTIETHFKQIETHYQGIRSQLGVDYLDQKTDFVFEKLKRREAETLFDGEHVTAAFRTVERSIDPGWLAQKMRDAILNHPKIHWLGNTTVEKAALRDDARIDLTFSCGAEQSRETYDRVVNCLWDGRLKLDASLGIVQARSWLHRFKLAITVSLAEEIPALPSTTLILGSFGDIVNFRRGKIYLSWYPSCMIGMSQQLAPPDYSKTLSDEKKEEVFGSSLQELSQICLALRLITPERILKKTVAGGSIFAWGQTDITDSSSALHTRYEIGVSSTGNYHSVNTGKYCTAPLIAIDVCDRVTGVV